MTWFTCPSCSAIDRVSPPHGVGVPCPVLARRNIAKLGLLEAQTRYYEALAEAVREPATEIPWPQREEVDA